jgi:hypothetical protein
MGKRMRCEEKCLHYVTKSVCCYHRMSIRFQRVLPLRNRFFQIPISAVSRDIHADTLELRRHSELDYR